MASVNRSYRVTNPNKGRGRGRGRGTGRGRGRGRGKGRGRGSKSSIPGTFVVEDDSICELALDEIEHKLAVPKVSEDNNYDEEQYFVFDNQEEDGVLLNIFDVPDPSTFFLKPCLKIPKPPQNFDWLPEYNEIDPRLILLSEYDISCLLQRVKKLKLNDPYKAKCECGKIGDAPKEVAEEMFLDDDDDFLLSTQFNSVLKELETKTKDEKLKSQTEQLDPVLFKDDRLMFEKFECGKIGDEPKEAAEEMFLDDDDDFLLSTQFNSVLKELETKTKDEKFKSQTEQVDPELFKDDLLMFEEFEDDDFTEDFFEQSTLNYNPTLENANKTPSKYSSKTSQGRKKKRRKLNPFLEMEAKVSGDDSNSGSCSSEEEFEGLDEYDESFVDHENEHSITDTQQVRYMQSVKDVVPVYTRRTEHPVTNQNGDTSHIEDEDLDYDESDSFCVPNDERVEIEDIGFYTQAMNNAREEVLSEKSPFAKIRKTRRQTSQAKTRELELKNRNKPKARKRIIIRDESSSDEQ